MSLKLRITFKIARYHLEMNFGSLEISTASINVFAHKKKNINLVIGGYC